MKKLTIILITVLSFLAMAAQKPCGEAFPDIGLKSKLGLDGSRCIVSKFKSDGGEIIMKYMMSHDNSMFTAVQEGWRLKNDKKVTFEAVMKCEDVGAGQVFECNTTIVENGKRLPDETGKKYSVVKLSRLFAGSSAVDIRYLFNGYAPWEYADQMGW